MRITPISIAKLRFFDLLTQKKYRIENQLYIAEGRKLLQEAILTNQPIEYLIVSEGYLQKYQTLPTLNTNLFSCSDAHYKKLSDLSSPEGIMCILPLPKEPLIAPLKPALLVDKIQDPGNLGTLLRTAVWFGFETIYYTENTVDCFSPKAVRSSMGAIFRQQFIQVRSIEDFIKANVDRIICTTVEKGTSIIEAIFPKYPIVWLGNESVGIQEVNMPNSILKVQIPNPNNSFDSLNVSIAGSILMYKIWENNITKMDNC